MKYRGVRSVRYQKLSFVNVNGDELEHQSFIFICLGSFPDGNFLKHILHMYMCDMEHILYMYVCVTRHRHVRRTGRSPDISPKMHISGTTVGKL